MPEQKNSRYHRIVFFIILGFAIAAAVYLLKNYISLIVISVMYSILIHPLYERFHKKFKWQKPIAAITTVLITFFTLVIPVLLLGALVAQEALEFRLNIVSVINTETLSIENATQSVNRLLLIIPGAMYQITEADVENLVRQFAGPSGTFLANRLISFGASSAVFIANVFIFLVLVFFLVPELDRVKRFSLRLSPLPDHIDLLYVQRMVSMTRAMIKGTFFVAIVQGVLGGILLWAVGIPYVLVLTIIMTVLSIIPVLSTALITIPIAVYFLLTGSIIKGVIIILVQVLLISTIDNILRPLLASGEGHLHPALLLLAILGGLSVFGFLGLFYGPLILIFLTTSLEVYQKYYK